MSADRSVCRSVDGTIRAALGGGSGTPPLQPGDLEQLAAAAYLIGKAIWARAHQEFITRGLPERAARSAFWLAFSLLQKGERARGAGWVARARRLLDDSGRECVERGYLLLPAGKKRIGACDLQRAHGCFCGAADMAERFADADLAVLARHSRGRVLILMGETAAGVALLDEAMAAVDAGDVSPALPAIRHQSSRDDVRLRFTPLRHTARRDPAAAGRVERGARPGAASQAKYSLAPQHSTGPCRGSIMAPGLG
jgi:hypothetical protein